MDLSLFSAGAVFAVVFILLVFIMVKRKAFFVGSVAVSLATLALAALCVAASFGAFTSGAQKAEKASEQPDNDAYFASVLLVNGSTDEAISLMERSVAEDEKPDGLLMLARLNAVAGNERKSLLYYLKYEKQCAEGTPREVTDEKNYLLNAIRAGRASNGALSEYYEQNADAALTAEVLPTSLGPENFIKSVKDRIDASVESSGQRLKNAAEAVALSAELRSSDEKELDPEKLEEVKKAAGSLNKIIKNDKSLKSNRAVREAALYLNCRVGDSGAIAENLSEHSVDRELEVAAELIGAGLVTPADMKGVKRPYTDDQLSQVRDRCSAIYSSSSGSLDSGKRREYKEQIDAIENSKNDYAPVTVLGWLTDAADEKSCEDDSKAFLEAAKGYAAIGLSRKASDCLDSALETAGTSGDSEYAEKMGAIKAVITGVDSENVMHVSEYVSEALELAAPVDSAAMNPSSTVKLDKDENGQIIPADTEGAIRRITEEISRTAEKKRAVINIGRVDSSGFDKVSFTVSFGDGAGITEKNFRDLVSVSDCGYYITEYEVKKLDDLKGRIILLCDISGSMSGKESDLRAAVEGFAEDMGRDEMIAVAGFSSGLEFRSDFLDSKDLIAEYASRLNAGGGTAIVSSMESISTMFSKEYDLNNILIVMTDGQDGNRLSTQSLRDRIGLLVASYDCTVYTIGLGDGVDREYLETIADIGNGRFVFSEHANGLETFYSFIHTQLSNRYLVTFTAKDKTQNERKIEVNLNEAVGTASKTYWLDESKRNDPDDDENDLVFRSANKTELFLDGLDRKVVYGTSKDVTLTLCGMNFSKDENYTVTLRGNLHPTKLNWSFVSDTMLSLTLPGGMPEGSYTLSVEGKNEKKELANALYIGSEKNARKTVTYGSYVFRCDSVKKTDQSITLSGNVVLNEWLTFNSEVTLGYGYDDRYSTYVTLTSTGGARIDYSPSGTRGLAKYLAERGVSVPVALPENVRIYQEKYDCSDYDKFPVQKFTVSVPMYIKTFAYIGGEFALYPDMFYSSAFYNEPELPFFRDLAKNLSNSIFRKNIEGSLVFTCNELCVNGKLELGYDKDNALEQKFSLTKLPLNLSALKLEVDTVKNEYSIEFEVGFADLKMMPKKVKGGVTFNGIGLKLGWKNSRLNELMFSASGKVTVTETPIPLYLTKVGFGVSDGLSEVNELKDLLNLTVTGKFNLSTVDILELIDCETINNMLNKDKLPLAEIDDATLNVCLGKLNINFSANLKVLDINMGKCQVNFGKFTYKNACLGLVREQYGAEISITLGPEFKFKNFEFTLRGTNDLLLGVPCSFFTSSGRLHFLITWGPFDYTKDLDGDFTFGFFNNDFGEYHFVIMAKGTADGNKTSGFRVDWSRSAGFDWSKL
ncbi:MAG: VWA domain-containing protein [Clostridia bacterium]|nr:VWA domain-containing protein [Clostridia bacterium]